MSVGAFTGLVAGIINTDSLPNTTTDNTIPAALNLVFAISTSIALLMIVIGGLRYILAHGDPNSMTQAKNTIMYALIGLVVVMAAYSIVTFVVKGL